MNTIFEVARKAGLRTAWADKHPAYEILNGPSGTGIQDLFTPEINSDAPTLGRATTGRPTTRSPMQYDSYKVQAVLNEINGFDHSGTTQVGTPAIFGMNFQTVSTAEKLPTSDGLAGGYLADGVTPGPLLQQRARLHQRAGRRSSVSAIHGQRTRPEHRDHPLGEARPVARRTRSRLTRIPDGPIIDALNAAWKLRTRCAGDLVAFSVDDDGMLIWLSDRSHAATRVRKGVPAGTHAAPATTSTAMPSRTPAPGCASVYAGADARGYF